MQWGTNADDKTGTITLTADEQRKLSEAGRDEPVEVSKVVGCSKGYHRLAVTLTPIADPYA